jgi:hypothetical protein
MCSYYVGPSYIGNEFDRPSRRTPAFSPVATRASVPIAPPPAAGKNLIDELAAIHEAAHVVHAHINATPIHDVRIEGQGRGGGQFRPFAGPDLMPLLTGNEKPIHVEASDKPRRGWCRTLVSFLVPKLSQRKYAGSAGDSMCLHDDAILSRVLSSISRSPDDERRMRAQIQAEAESFVNKYWGEILLVARALFARGRLDKREIAHILRDLPTKITLNQSAADYASSLVAGGKINWGPFAWNDETDGADLLDEEGEDALAFYHLGSSRKISIALPDNGTVCAFLPFMPVNLSMRFGGMFHVAASMSISDQRAPCTSPVLAAVRIANSNTPNKPRAPKGTVGWSDARNPAL